LKGPEPEGRVRAPPVSASRLEQGGGGGGAGNYDRHYGMRGYNLCRLHIERE